MVAHAQGNRMQRRSDEENEDTEEGGVIGRMLALHVKRETSDPGRERDAGEDVGDIGSCVDAVYRRQKKSVEAGLGRR